MKTSRWLPSIIISGIFAINDPSALGAYSVLAREGKADQVKIVGFDGQPEGKQAIKEGKIYADPIQYPDEKPYMAPRSRARIILSRDPDGGELGP